MKKTLLAFAVLFALSTASNAQYSKSDIFKRSVDKTWLGVDFSELKYIGEAQEYGDDFAIQPKQMRDHYFPAWNELIVTESQVYREKVSMEWRNPTFKIAKGVNKAKVLYATEITSDANAKTDLNSIFSENINDFQLLSEAKVQNMVNTYNFNGKTGIGFLMIAEGMSKVRKEASYWVTFVDMKSKKVLLTKRMLGKAAGFGFRNYWTNTIKSIFKGMRKDFKKWD